MTESNIICMYVIIFFFLPEPLSIDIAFNYKQKE